MLLDTTNPQTTQTETGQTGVCPQPDKPQIAGADLAHQPIAHPATGSPPGTPESGPGHLRKPGSADAKSKTDGERYDAYGGALFEIPGTAYRLAVCREGRQWILQHRKGRDQWIGVKFFSNRRRLAIVLKELIDAPTFRAIEAKIAALPI